jgi:hypothetical protein
MTRRGSFRISAPCAYLALSAYNYWSGREDSNLRPLPPEGVAPSRARCFSAVFPRGDLRSGGQCSLGVHGKRFTVNLGPCLYGGRTW